MGLQQPVREVPGAASGSLAPGADPGVHSPGPVAVALVNPLHTALAPAVPGAADRIGRGAHQVPARTPSPCRATGRSQPSPGACVANPAGPIVDAATAFSFTCAAKNLVRMTRWSLQLWDLGLLRPSYTTSVNANSAATSSGGLTGRAQQLDGFSARLRRTQRRVPGT
jgi:hypothetical protein